MNVTKYEQETIILFNEQEAAATIYTYNTGLRRTLISLCESHPAQVRQTEDNGIGALTFELPWHKYPRPGRCRRPRRRCWKI